MAIRVIIMDVDGTLFNSNKAISKETKKVLKNVQKQGIKLILASGRPTSGLVHIGKELEMDKHDGLFVSYNGSQVIDCQTMEILFNQTMSIEEGKAVLEHMKKFEVYPMIDKNNHMYVNNVYAKPIQFRNEDFNVIEYEARGCGFLLCEQEDLAEFLDFELNKILTAGETPYLQANYQKMAEPFIGKLNCTFTSPFFYEFTALGIDKAKALETVLIPLGYKVEEMIAFGDGMNDLSMLEYVGIGVAMQNADDAVKEKADFITKSNDQDGIAHALYHYIPGLIDSSKSFEEE